MNALNMLICGLIETHARRYKDQSEEMTPPNDGIRSKIAVLCALTDELIVAAVFCLFAPGKVKKAVKIEAEKNTLTATISGVNIRPATEMALLTG